MANKIERAIDWVRNFAEARLDIGWMVAQKYRQVDVLVSRIGTGAEYLNGHHPITSSKHRADIYGRFNSEVVTTDRFGGIG